MVTAIKETTSGRIGKLLRRERNYFLRNAKADRLNYAKAQAAKLPIGSGSIESGVRRVINLRLKGASIYWLEESANSMLLLRSFYVFFPRGGFHRWGTYTYPSKQTRKEDEERTQPLPHGVARTEVIDHLCRR